MGFRDIFFLFWCFYIRVPCGCYGSPLLILWILLCLCEWWKNMLLYWCVYVRGWFSCLKSSGLHNFGLHLCHLSNIISFLPSTSFFQATESAEYAREVGSAQEQAEETLGWQIWRAGAGYPDTFQREREDISRAVGRRESPAGERPATLGSWDGLDSANVEQEPEGEGSRGRRRDEWAWARKRRESKQRCLQRRGRGIL